MRHRVPFPALCLVLLLPTALMAAENTLQRIQRENTLRVGVANEQPYGYVTEAGELTGEAPAILRRIMADIDPEVKLVPVVTEFQDLIRDLRQGEFDVMAAGMFVVPDRCKQVNFTEPTYQVGEALAVRADNPKNLTDFASVAAAPDARLAVMAGAMEYSYAYDAGVFVDQVTLIPDYPTGLTELLAGEIDAIAGTALTMRKLVEGHPEVEATTQFIPVTGEGEEVAGYGAFAVRKQDRELLAALNQHLNGFIGSEEHWETVAPFGFGPDMAPDRTKAQLCNENKKS